MKKKKLIITIVIVAIVIAITGGIIAYLTDTDTTTNTFTIGSVKISLTEPSWNPTNGQNIIPGQPIDKDPKITNTGNNPAHVYMKVEQPIVNLNDGTQGPLFNHMSKYYDGWFLLSGYVSDNNQTLIYYYGDLLEKNASTPTLFDTVEINDFAQSSVTGNKDMIITGYAIQSSYLPSGTTIPSAYSTYFTQNSFATDSWETIIQNVQSGNTSNYNIGDIKTVDMGSAFGKQTLRIVNKSTPSECSTTGFSQTACGFVLEFVDNVTLKRMNPYTSGNTNNGNGTKGGWQYSEARTYINSNIYNSLPTTLKNNIINTTVVSGYGKNDSSNFVTTDKLFLLDVKELYGDFYDNKNRHTAKNVQRQLDYYKYLGITDTNYFGAVKSGPCWFRSPLKDSPSSFYSVYPDEGYGKSSATSTSEYGISPAFRLG